MMKFGICANCQTRKWVYTSNICQDCIDEMMERFGSGVLSSAKEITERHRSD